MRQACELAGSYYSRTDITVKAQLNQTSGTYSKLEPDRNFLALLQIST